MAGEEKVDRRLNNPKAGRPPGRKNNKTIQREERVAKQKATIAKNKEQQTTQSNQNRKKVSFFVIDF